MALAVDTKHLLNEVPPNCERLYNDSLDPADRSRGRRVQLRRVCVYATVTYDGATRGQFDEHCGYDDPRQRSTTTTKPGIRCARPSDGVVCRTGTTTLVASVQSPMVTSCTQRHRSPSPFRHHLTRINGEMNINRNHMLSEARCHFVSWCVQLYFFDFSSQSTYVLSSPGKRRRTLDPFHHVSPRHDEERTTRAHDHPAPEAKRFKGVRYRPDHKRWVAEMKPPKSRNKVSFGEFRSQTDAARVVDVAFQHYGRTLNFPDYTPHILSSQPPSAGLSVEEKLKDQIKWMKSRISSLPSPIQGSQRSGPRSSGSAATTQTMPSRNHTRAGCRRSCLKCGIQGSLKESRRSRLDSYIELTS